MEAYKRILDKIWLSRLTAMVEEESLVRKERAENFGYLERRQGDVVSFLEACPAMKLGAPGIRRSAPA
jgi:hypothetical protein